MPTFRMDFVIAAAALLLAVAGVVAGKYIFASILGFYGLVSVIRAVVNLRTWPSQP